MTRCKSRFEDLPNELLTDIFKNLHARELFRAFHNLNTRLNQLVQSLDSFQYLQLVFRPHQFTLLKSTDEIFSYYVHTLIVDTWININLTQFPNVRRLRLDKPLPKVLEQLKPEVMPYLEDLSVTYVFSMYEMDLLRDKIFSNGFSHLRSCELLEEGALMIIPNWTQSPSINILKIDLIDSLVYKTILSACPNLYFLEFWLNPSNEMPITMPLHKNLKRMIIKSRKSNGFYHYNHILYELLACVPNLEVLEIHRTFSLQKTEQYDWSASIIHFCLPILRKFKFIFHLLKDEKLSESTDNNRFLQIQRDFLNAHGNQYKAQLTINRD